METWIARRSEAFMQAGVSIESRSQKQSEEGFLPALLLSEHPSRGEALSPPADRIAQQVISGTYLPTVRYRAVSAVPM